METYVAPAIIKSTGLILVRQDKAAMNPVVERITMTNLAVKPLTKLQIITGVRRRSVNRGARMICTARLIGDGGNM
jgi:hypothetical protein